MKKSLFIILLVCTTFAVFAQNASKLNIVYFHAERRCPTCISIEENTKKTLNTYFAKQLKEGKITFQVINVDEDKNKAMVEKYEADGSGLFLTRVTSGKESTTNFTNFAFSYSRNQAQKFISGLKAEIEKNMK